MFSTKRPAAKKQRSWETVDAADDDAPSETFLKLQRELADRDRLAQEKSGNRGGRSSSCRGGRGGAHSGRSAGGPRRRCLRRPKCVPGRRRGGLRRPRGANDGVEVQDFNGRTRLHELKAHFHPFGDVVEVALMGKKV